MKCLECGCELISVSETTETIIKCPNCGWMAVTTNMADIEDDITKYSIIIEPENEAKIEMIKMISHFSGKNVLEAKKILSDGGVMICDYANNISEIIDKLDFIGIKYHITPQYPY